MDRDSTPTGRRNSRTALLDAVEELCVSHAPSDVTMRQIAERADVSVGLVYHHFDSKVDLLGAALTRMGQQFADAAVDAAEPEDVVPALVAAMRERPAFARIVAWFILRGDDVTELMGRHPMVAGIGAQATEAGHARPSDLAAALALIGLGSSFFGPAVARATGTDPSSRDAIDLLARGFAHIAHVDGD